MSTLNENTPFSSEESEQLRQRAEDFSRENSPNLPEDVARMSPEDIQEMLHELRVHQIELEMQNEELRRTRVERDLVSARYFDLYDLAPVGYCTISEKGLIVETNLTAATMLGYARSELIKQPFSRFILKEDQDSYYLHRKILFETEDPQGCTLRMVKQDGDVIWVHLSAAFWEDEAGSPFCRVVLSDISKLKQVEEELKKSQALLKETEKTGHVGGWEFDVAALTQTWTEETFRILEIDVSKGTPKVPQGLGFILPAYRAKAEQGIQRAIELGEPYDQEWEVVTAKGNHRWVHSVANPHFEQGKVKTITGSFQDITSRKQAEEQILRLNNELEQRVKERTAQLEKSNEDLKSTTQDLALLKGQFELILQNSPDGFLLTDLEGNVLQANRSFLRMFSSTAKEINQLNFFENLNKFGLQNREGSFQLNLNEGKPIYFKTHIKEAPDTESFDCAVTITPVMDCGHLSAIVISFHDISESVELQRMKDAFVSNVSHELRTPITNLICTLEMMRMRPENTPTYLNRLDHETVNLKNIIEDLLHLSLLDQKGIDAGKTQFDLNELCHDIVEMRALLAEDKGLKLTCLPENGIQRVFGDEGLIRQVMSILVTNAINYTPKGGIIQLKMIQRVYDGHSEIGFAVIDNGPGISLDDQARIGKRFYRGKAGLESGVSGTGLGLSIADQILKLHGGKLEIISAGVSGQGSTFNVWLPSE